MQHACQAPKAFVSLANRLVFEALADNHNALGNQSDLSAQHLLLNMSLLTFWQPLSISIALCITQDIDPVSRIAVTCYRYMNTLQDAAAVVRMLQQYFVQPMRNSPAHEQVAACSSCPPSSRSKLSHLPESRGVCQSILMPAARASICMDSMHQPPECDSQGLSSQLASLGPCSTSRETSQLCALDTCADGARVDRESSSLHPIAASSSHEMSKEPATISDLSASCRSGSPQPSSMYPSDSMIESASSRRASTSSDSSSSCGDTHSSLWSQHAPASASLHDGTEPSGRLHTVEQLDDIPRRRQRPLAKFTPSQALQPLVFQDQRANALAAATREIASAPCRADAGGTRRIAPTLAAMWIYPIKSCAGCRVDAWPLCPTGLLFDRHWALVNADRIVLTQKRLPALASLSPRLDLQQGAVSSETAKSDADFEKPINSV